MNILFQRHFLVKFIPFLTGIYLIILGLAYYIVQQHKKRIIHNSIDVSNSFLYIQEDILLSAIIPTISDLSFLARRSFSQNYFIQERGKQLLLEDMRNLVLSQRNFFQVKYLDTLGFELLRINSIDGQAEVVSEDERQNHSLCPYFIKSKKLKPGDIYISPIELNIEHNNKDISNQRIIRFSSAVFDSDGNRKGILMIYQYLNKIFAEFKNSSPPNNFNLMLLNRSGFWLIHPDTSKEYGFLYDINKAESFGASYPQVWKALQADYTGYYESKKQLFVFKDVSLGRDIMFINTYPDSQIIMDDENVWKFVLVADKKSLNGISTLKSFFIVGSIALFLLAGIVSYSVFKLRYKEMRYIKSVNSLNQELEAKVENRTRQLENKNIELKNLNNELEAFTYSVSHDLRAPLRHVIAFVDLVLANKGNIFDDKTEFYLQNIKEASKDMSVLIENLLNLSHIGRVELNLDTFHLDKVVAETCKLIEQEFKGREIKWDIAEMPKVRADYALLKQVWFNLFHNAVKYSSKKPYSLISVDSISNSEAYIFSVKDNGVGFDMKYKNELFKPFHRLHPKEEYEGTGIGLANIKRIISRHGGNVWAESNENEGAIFYFTIPKH